MSSRASISGWAVAALLVMAEPVGSQPPESPRPAPEPEPSVYAARTERRADTWTAGTSAGVLGSTPDGSALTMNGHVEYFVDEHVSIGPLLQVGVTSDSMLVGLSGQAKYWMDLPGTENRGKLTLQSGVGFAHASFRSDDTSWLVPLGVGIDYALSPQLNIAPQFLLNFTDLHTGGGSGADVMPGFALGLRF